MNRLLPVWVSLAILSIRAIFSSPFASLIIRAMPSAHSRGVMAAGLIWQTSLA